ncbi:interleukin-1 receptor type 1-like isoform X2 [Engraulis encrasicolus]|uniref:interleukin-1 receptor type 1-like isoform X2 n=2 Tax=Engraulis encrasicolus TaxID=184585 RepID=UPI002FCF765B
MSCPEGDHAELYKSGEFVRLDCDVTMEHIVKVFPPSSVTWLKECKPLPRGEVNGHKLQIENVLTADAGNYTCVLNFTYEGRNYRASRTTNLVITAPPPRHRTEIKIPLNETRAVTIGSREELRCEATEIENEITTVDWKINGTLIQNSTNFTISKTHGNNTSVNTLTIIKVKAKHLNVNFTCMATNALGSARSTVVLKEANEGHVGWLVAGICLCVLLIACVLLWHCFKVDLVLLYRSLCPRTHDNDGKHYDAYVSYPYESQGLSMTFALRLLPEVLENKHGYKLFIRGRDDDPGQGSREHGRWMRCV